MRKFSVERPLRKILDKLFKRDHVTYETIMSKIREIVNCENADHYKNLRSPLQEFKRVHINGPFVLVFRYLPSEDKVEFFDFDHHDDIYSKAF